MNRNASPRTARLWTVLLATALAGLTAGAAAALGSGGVSAPSSTTGGSGTTDSTPSYVFPVKGRHTYGDGWGAGRGHQGQDIMAACGTKLVAARAGKVQVRGRHSRAGNYVVIDNKGTGQDFAYMHLKSSAIPRKGESVKTGQRIGYVGKTGNASACHLHFEIWTSPGYYQGGKPIDPRPKLKKWDAYS